MFEQKKTLGGAVKKYNLSIGSHPNCTITLTPGAGKYKAGTVIKVSVTCSTGWQIGQITWNGTAVANNGTFTMPKADVTVACTTSQINYTITKSVPSGGGSITCAATAHYNDTVTYSTTPSADWAFSNCALSGSKTQTGMGASGSFVMPAGNVTLTVNFFYGFSYFESSVTCQNYSSFKKSGYKWIFKNSPYGLWGDHTHYPNTTYVAPNNTVNSYLSSIEDAPSGNPIGGTLVCDQGSFTIQNVHVTEEAAYHLGLDRTPPYTNLTNVHFNINIKP